MLKKIQELTEKGLKSNGIQALATRPNAVSTYGESDFSAEELKKRFDKYPEILRSKINEIINCITDPDYISVGDYFKHDGIESLYDFILSFRTGKIADLLHAYPSAEASEFSELVVLQDVINSFAADIAKIKYPTGEIADGERGPVSGDEVHKAIRTLLDYINNPTGDIAEGTAGPVSGEKVHQAISAARDAMVAYADNPSGEIADGERGPVSGEKIYEVVSGVDKRVSKTERMLGWFYDFAIESKTAKKHVIPSNFFGDFISLNSIGGHTRRAKNVLRLLPGTEFGWTDENSATPVHCWVDENGYFNIDSAGEDTGISAFFYPENILASKPNIVTVSARYISGTAAPSYAGHAAVVIGGLSIDLPTADNPVVTKTISNSFSEDSFILPVGCFTDYKVAIQAEAGAACTDFEPYFEGMRSAKVTAVKSYGKNLYDGEQSIVLAKTSGEKVLFSGNIFGTVALSWKKTGSVSTTSAALFSYKAQYGATQYATFASKSPIILDGIKELKLLNWCAAEGTLYDIQIEYGSAATAYVPYKGQIDTYEIPKAVRALEGYGSSEAYIDFADKAFINGEATTDISEYITDDVYLTVEGDGYIVVENEHGLEVPLSYTYQVKV